MLTRQAKQNENKGMEGLNAYLGPILCREPGKMLS